MSIGTYADNNPRVDADGTVYVPAFTLPESAYLGDKTRSVLKAWRNHHAVEWFGSMSSCPSFDEVEKEEMPDIRQCQAENFYKTDLYQEFTTLFDVEITSETLGGVYTEVFTPRGGEAKKINNVF